LTLFFRYSLGRFFLVLAAFPQPEQNPAREDQQHQRDSLLAAGGLSVKLI